MRGPISGEEIQKKKVGIIKKKKKEVHSRGHKCDCGTTSPSMTTRARETQGTCDHVITIPISVPVTMETTFNPMLQQLPAY